MATVDHIQTSLKKVKARVNKALHVVSAQRVERACSKSQDQQLEAEIFHLESQAPVSHNKGYNVQRQINTSKPEKKPSATQLPLAGYHSLTPPSLLSTVEPPLQEHLSICMLHNEDLRKQKEQLECENKSLRIENGYLQDLVEDYIDRSIEQAEDLKNRIQVKVDNSKMAS